MKNFFYKINRKYIEAFSNNVLSRFREEDIRSDVVFMRAVLTEVNHLFQRMGGRVSSKRDIPKAHEYPDATRYNRLLTGIATDIDKIYTAQKLIEDDVNNLINFNSTQRIRTFENLTTTQQEVYSTYIKNKGDIRGEIVVPAEDPFGSADNISPESEGIYIDESRGILTLDHTTKITKPVQLDGVRMFFAGAKPPEPVYPNGDQMGLGSHWKTPSSISAHHIDDQDQAASVNYKNMLVDDPNNNYGVGFCEFEGVQTTLAPQILTPSIRQSYRLSDTTEGQFYIRAMSSIGDSREVTAIKQAIGEESNKDPELIYVDIANSLQGKWVKWNWVPIFRFSGQTPQYKLVIPFTNDAPFTNQLTITVQPNALGNYPKLNWDMTRVYTNANGSDVAHNIIAPADPLRIPNNGEYVCNIRSGFIKPSRMEMIFEYGGDDIQWSQIGFAMGHWVYSTAKNYFLPHGANEKITLILGKTYDVYVDAEPNQEKEKQRALNVLLARGQ